MIRSLLCFLLAALVSRAADRPNVLLIYTDDLGYGDVSCYAGQRMRTPHIDRLAKEGLRFTDGHFDSATCTPSRYAMLTGEYAFRKKGTGVLTGDAAFIMRSGGQTTASVLQQAGLCHGCGGNMAPWAGKWRCELERGDEAGAA